MRTLPLAFPLALPMLALLCASAATSTPSVNGTWDATITFDELTIPFTIEFKTHAGKVEGSLFNGDERVTSTAGSFTGGALHLSFDHYATHLDATLAGDVLTGQYGGTRQGMHDFQARPHTDLPTATVTAPDISGLWDIPFESAKGEHAWRLIVRQNGPKVSAAILRVDGDTGSLTGRYSDGKFVLNTFDGGRGFHLELTQESATKLKVALAGIHSPEKQLIALRPSEARAQGIPEPTDPEKHTRMRDSSEPLRFAFPDLNGKLVSNTDPRFQGKVVLVNITGSWCPNCHDEAPFLEALYRQYHKLGLEIVALDFEEAAQLKDPTRLPAFIKRYGLEYTYLLAGSPDQLNEKVPQAENLNSWPTTFFLSRDGRVRAVHAGFAAAATGEFHTQMRERFTNTVQKLLSENAPAAAGAPSN
jgi:thiol-disulfide isomerase/thioredoxin